MGTPGGGTNVVITGSAALALANFIGIGGVQVYLSGTQVMVSGSAGEVSLAQLNSLSGFTTGMSGALQAQINAGIGGVTSLNLGTGALQLTGAGNVGVSVAGQIITISCDTGEYANFATQTQLANTGSALYNLLVTQSGQNAVDYATVGNLASTGGANWAYTDTVAANLAVSGTSLYGAIVQSGEAAVAYANGLNIAQSTALTQSGVALMAQNASLSGFTLDASGVLQDQISAIPASTVAATGTTLYALITGLSGDTNAQIAATSVTLATQNASLSGFTVGVSGVLQAQINAIPASTVAATGAALYTLITGLSGDMDSLLVLTGNAAVAHSNGNGAIQSGNLTQTGVTLGARVIASGNAAVIHANGIGTLLSGALTQSGVNLLARIVLTGNAAVAHANSNGAIQSGNLANSGVALQALLYPRTNPSGYITSGQTGGFATAANLTQTGATLFAMIVAGSGGGGGGGGVSSINGASGALSLTGAGSITVTRIGQVITVSGSSAGGGGVTGNYIPTNSATGFSTAMTSGVSEQYVAFPFTFSRAPYVQISVDYVHDIGYAVDVSGRSTTGFYAQYSDTVGESGNTLLIWVSV